MNVLNPVLIGVKDLKEKGLVLFINLGSRGFHRKRLIGTKIYNYISVEISMQTMEGGVATDHCDVTIRSATIENSLDKPVSLNLQFVESRAPAMLFPIALFVLTILGSGASRPSQQVSGDCEK